MHTFEICFLLLPTNIFTHLHKLQSVLIDFCSTEFIDKTHRLIQLFGVGLIFTNFFMNSLFAFNCNVLHCTFHVNILSLLFQKNVFKLSKINCSPNGKTRVAFSVFALTLSFLFLIKFLTAKQTEQSGTFVPFYIARVFSIMRACFTRNRARWQIRVS